MSNNNVTPQQLRELLERRLPGAYAHVLCDDDLNSAEVVKSGRILALIEIPQDPRKGWDPIVSARMATDDAGNMRAIVLQLRSESELDGSSTKSSKEKND